jgi:hypothetical protein
LIGTQPKRGDWQRSAASWLDTHYEQVGVTSTVDVAATYL